MSANDGEYRRTEEQFADVMREAFEPVYTCRTDFTSSCIVVNGERVYRTIYGGRNTGKSHFNKLLEDQRRAVQLAGQSRVAELCEKPRAQPSRLLMQLLGRVA